MSERTGGSRSSGFRIRNMQDFSGGVVLILIALFAFMASWDLPGMRGFQFGPGTAPRLFAGLLVVFGGFVSLGGVLADGPGFPRYYWRGPVLVTASILLFAAAIRPLGLVVACFGMFMFSATGSKDTRWVECTIAAVAMTVFCVLLFVYLLNLPFQLWPRFTIGGVTIAF